jgi:hypothetical protein
MNLPILGRAVDERFLIHRLRSTSIAGITCTVLAMFLFAYRFYFNHIWSWDLLAVGITNVVVKLTALTWFRLRD